MGDPILPAVDQSLGPGAVAPNLIEFPYLPSIIWSPSKGNKGFIFNCSSK